jgi:hypothetical protein
LLDWTWSPIEYIARPPFTNGPVRMSKDVLTDVLVYRRKWMDAPWTSYLVQHAFCAECKTWMSVLPCRHILLVRVRLPFAIDNMKRHKLASLLPTWRGGLDRLYSKSLSTGSLQGLQRPHMHGVPHGTPSAGRSCWHGRSGLFSAKASR